MSVHHSDIGIWCDGVGGFLPFTEKFTFYRAELLFQPKALSVSLTQLVHTEQDGMWTNECMMLYTAHMKKMKKKEITWGCLAVVWWLKMIFSCFYMSVDQAKGHKGLGGAWLLGLSTHLLLRHCLWRRKLSENLHQIRVANCSLSVFLFATGILFGGGS